LHLFRLHLEHSDLFVEKLDLLSKEIVYSVRDAVGKLMNTPKKETFTIADGNIYFDLNREIALPLAAFISETLHELPEVNKVCN